MFNVLEAEKVEKLSIPLESFIKKMVLILPQLS